MEIESKQKPPTQAFWNGVQEWPRFYCTRFLPVSLLTTAALALVGHKVERLTFDSRWNFAPLTARIVAALPDLYRTACVAPLREEFKYRMCGYNIFTWPFGHWEGVVLSSLYFGFAHIGGKQSVAVNLFRLAVATTGGIAFAELYEREGSIFAPMGMHVAHNLYCTIQQQLARSLVSFVVSI